MLQCGTIVELHHLFPLAHTPFPLPTCETGYIFSSAAHVPPVDVAKDATGAVSEEPLFMPLVLYH